MQLQCVNDWKFIRAFPKYRQRVPSIAHRLLIKRLLFSDENFDNYFEYAWFDANEKISMKLHLHRLVSMRALHNNGIFNDRRQNDDEKQNGEQKKTNRKKTNQAIVGNTESDYTEFYECPAYTRTPRLMHGTADTMQR